jgi:hypothetical protein
VRSARREDVYRTRSRERRDRQGEERSVNVYREPDAPPTEHAVPDAPSKIVEGLNVSAENDDEPAGPLVLDVEERDWVVRDFAVPRRTGLVKLAYVAVIVAMVVIFVVGIGPSGR